MTIVVTLVAGVTAATGSTTGAPTPKIDRLNQLARAITHERAERCLSVPNFRWHPGYKVPSHMRDLVIGQREVRLNRVRRMNDRCTPWYVTKQILVATIIGPWHVDAWPNCPDPFDSSRYTWTDTVNCENSGSWLDSPGFYRCGLQFDPSWERRFGRLCP